MRYLKIENRKLNGDVGVPPSKSDAHRAIICAALAHGRSRINNVDLSEDMIATIEGMRALGAEIEVIKENTYNTLIIEGTRKGVGACNIDCCESGSTLRFIIPIILWLRGEGCVSGRGKLIERPLDVYYDMFKEKSIEYKNNDGNLPLQVKGDIKSGIYTLRGDVSSQFISGLMFVLPLMSGESRIKISTELQSKSYVDMTINTIREFGVDIENKEYKEFVIKGNQNYRSREYTVEGDYSQCAFWMAAGVIGGNLEIGTLKRASAQADSVVVDIIKGMGGKVEVQGEYISTSCSRTEGTVIDVGECPDIAPILTVIGAVSSGETRIVNGSRLRIKESDRLKSISTELNKLGADITEEGDSLIIKGRKTLKGGVVDSWNDHRIAMSLAVASIVCQEPVFLSGWESVKKSYPKFYEDFKGVGGEIHECSLGE